MNCFGKGSRGYPRDYFMMSHHAIVPFQGLKSPPQPDKREVLVGDFRGFHDEAPAVFPYPDNKIITSKVRYFAFPNAIQVDQHLSSQVVGLEPIVSGFLVSLFPRECRKSVHDRPFELKISELGQCVDIGFKVISFTYRVNECLNLLLLICLHFESFSRVSSLFEFFSEIRRILFSAFSVISNAYHT